MQQTCTAASCASRTQQVGVMAAFSWWLPHSLIQAPGVRTNRLKYAQCSPQVPQPACLPALHPRRPSLPWPARHCGARDCRHTAAGHPRRSACCGGQAGGQGSLGRRVACPSGIKPAIGNVLGYRSRCLAAPPCATLRQDTSTCLHPLRSCAPGSLMPTGGGWSPCWGRAWHGEAPAAQPALGQRGLGRCETRYEGSSTHPSKAVHSFPLCHTAVQASLLCQLYY